MVKLLLANVKNTISASLDCFSHELRLKSGLPSFSSSQQAFSKARSKISHSIFKEAFENTLDFLCSHDSFSFHSRFLGVWGRHIIAIDGSKIPLPNQKALLDKYGSIGRGDSSPTAIASVAFDVLNNRVLDAQFEPICVDERSLAIKHINHIKSNSRTNLLYTMFVFDRGYASKELIGYIEDTIHTGYLFRLSSKFNNAIDALPASKDQYGISDSILVLGDRKVRVLKFYLPSRILETLITNDFGLDKNLFRQCYFLRWPVEENYKLIKKIGLTNFRDYSGNSVLQKFWISMLLANLTLVIKKETDGIIDSTINQKDNKHRYITNINELVGCLSQRLSEYMDSETTAEKFAILRNIFRFAISHRVRDKKGCGESSPRNIPRKVKHHYNNKATH